MWTTVVASLFFPSPSKNRVWLKTRSNKKTSSNNTFHHFYKSYPKQPWQTETEQNLDNEKGKCGKSRLDFYKLMFTK